MITIETLIMLVADAMIKKVNSPMQSLFANVNIGVILLQYYSITIERNVQQKTTKSKIIIRL